MARQGDRKKLQVNQNHTAKVSSGSGEKIKTHLNWEEAGEVVSPVIPSSQHDPLLYPILWNGLGTVAHPQLHWQGYREEAFSARQRQPTLPLHRDSFIHSHQSPVVPTAQQMACRS